MPEDLPRLQEAPLVLRAFAAKDLQLIQDASTDPLIPVITSVPSTQDASAAQAFITRQLARLRNGEGYSFAIADSTTDEAFGQIGLWLLNLAQGRASVGCWVAARHRGQGVASRALGMISTWGLGLPGVHRLELYVEPWNEASCEPPSTSATSVRARSAAGRSSATNGETCTCTPFCARDTSSSPTQRESRTATPSTPLPPPLR